MTKVALEPGDFIEEYEILEKVGGNMGLVFKARHRLLNKVVALKLLPANWVDPARQARFEREIRIMGQLEHPNLVTAADARIVGDWHLVAMEWIDGMDLLQLVRSQGRLPIAVACEVARQAAVGLQYAHQHGLIHRDIKPSNLMVNRSGIIKVIDMGLALARDDTAPQLTQTGLVLGTLGYCAPEQFRDASRVGIGADIYGLGCTLFHLLAGRSPYSQRKTITEMMEAHLNEPFPSLLEARPDAPPELEKVIARMTAKDPDARFGTPGEVAAALEPFARGADLKPLVPPSTGQGPLARTIVRRERGVTPPPRSRRTRLAAVIVLLVTIAGGLFLAQKWWQRERTPVVVLMDTTADRGVYDPENKGKGITNAEELEKVLRELSLGAIHKEPVSLNWIYTHWVGEARVLGFRPDLVIIHRSSFFHPLNAELGFGYPPFTNNPALQYKWETLYRVGDAMLISFLGNVAAAAPRTKLLVYSRGTDTNWFSKPYREQWVNEASARIPALKGRLDTMLIPGEQKGTFKDPETANRMRDRVKTILRLPEKRRSNKNEQTK